MANKKAISEVMSHLAKLSNKKAPRSSEFYKKIQKKRVYKKKGDLSTGKKK